MSRFINFDSKRKIESDNTRVSAAVFAHLYYEDELEKYISYLERLPENVDLYILTPNELLKEKACSYLQDRAVYLDTINRGRDLAALLVAAADYVSQYDYFCFVHDKKPKTKDQAEFTNEWTYMMWESLLASHSYISQILNYFADNKNIGIIFPPAQIGKYSGLWYSGFWGINYDSTIELAKKLGMTKAIARTDEPISLGTMFWARREALNKLLNYGWQYEDFPEEPLPDDGAISHAIERVLQFVALDEGYESINCTTSEYINKYVEQILRDHRTAANILDKEYGVHTQEMADDYCEKKKRLLEYIDGKHAVYIYGAGWVGKSCKRYLEGMGIAVDAFIVSSYSGQEPIDGIPVRGVNDVTLDNGVAIVIAVRTDYKKQILSMLSSYGELEYIEYI